jgi:hypothetical protein
MGCHGEALESVLRVGVRWHLADITPNSMKVRLCVVVGLTDFANKSFLCFSTKAWPC